MIASNSMGSIGRASGKPTTRRYGDEEKTPWWPDAAVPSDLVEGWFKLLAERRVRRGTFNSVDLNRPGFVGGS